MIKTKCVYDAAEPEDGLRVLVTCGWPRLVKKSDVDVWWPQLGPSVELLADWRQEKITWEEYTERFEGEMLAMPSAILLLGLRAWHQRYNGDITLLCVEKERDPLKRRCHRDTLKRLIERE